jgi:NADH:ubiquinone oxidoreductase subunit H
MMRAMVRAVIRAVMSAMKLLLLLPMIIVVIATTLINDGKYYGQMKRRICLSHVSAMGRDGVISVHTTLAKGVDSSAVTAGELY